MSGVHPLLVSVHGLIGLSLVIPGLMLLAFAAAGWIRRSIDRQVLDWLVLAGIVFSVVAGASGLVTAVVAGRPPQPLHWVYGVSAVAVLPAARYLGRSGDLRRRAGWLVLGALVLLAIVARLSATGR